MTFRKCNDALSDLISNLQSEVLYSRLKGLNDLAVKGSTQIVVLEACTFGRKSTEEASPYRYVKLSPTFAKRVVLPPLLGGTEVCHIVGLTVIPKVFGTKRLVFDGLSKAELQKHNA
jgi:hypothetical protein